MSIDWHYGIAIKGYRPYMIILDDIEETYEMKKWCDIFPRVENRKQHIRCEDMIKAGYPFVITDTPHWTKLHELCKEQFVNGQGKFTYLWFGSRFFFTTKEDADLFRGLLYLL